MDYQCKTLSGRILQLSMKFYSIDEIKKRREIVHAVSRGQFKINCINHRANRRRQLNELKGE